MGCSLSGLEPLFLCLLIGDGHSFPSCFIIVMRIGEMPEELSNRSVCHLSRYPRKKFWIGKPIARVVKKKTGEFSDKLLSLQRGLREFQGESWGCTGAGVGPS